MAQALKPSEPPSRSGSRGENTGEEARAWVIHKTSHAKRGAPRPSSSGQPREGRLASTNHDLHAFRLEDLITLSL